MFDPERITITDVALSKLKGLADSWNAQNPLHCVVPAIFVFDFARLTELALGVGFLKASRISDELVIQRSGFRILIDLVPEHLEIFYKYKIDYGEKQNVFFLAQIES